MMQNLYPVAIPIGSERSHWPNLFVFQICQTTVNTSKATVIDYEVSEKLESKNYEKIDDKLVNLDASGEVIY